MEVTWKIIESVLGGAFVIIGYLMKNRIEKSELDIKELKEEMSEFKDNYLSRFEKVNNGINSSKLEIIEKIHQLELSVKNKK